MRLHALIVLPVALLLAAAPALAQWKWKDSRGQIVVSDTPPPRDIPERDVLGKPEPSVRRAASAPAAASAPEAGTAAKAEAAAKPKVDPELEARRKKLEQEQADKQKAEDEKVAAARAENCKRARSQMSTLESGIRLSRTNDKGEREILDDKQRAEEMARTRAIIASECRQ
ncbi:MAG: DUF4124 domain-containing protein [Burkholderiaceae bacterium]